MEVKPKYVYGNEVTVKDDEFYRDAIFTVVDYEIVAGYGMEKFVKYLVSFNRGSNQKWFAESKIKKHVRNKNVKRKEASK